MHNAWHYALYLLEAGDTPGALAVYDQFLHHSGSEDIALELLDATALLWRLWLEGIPVGDRWGPLAQAWARLLTPGFYPFNDMHAIMAFAGNGELGRAWEVVAALERVVSSTRRRPDGRPAWAMTAAVGLPVCRGLAHFGAGRVRPRRSPSCCPSAPGCTNSAAATPSVTRWSGPCSRRRSWPGGWTSPARW